MKEDIMTTEQTTDQIIKQIGEHLRNWPTGHVPLPGMSPTSVQTPSPVAEQPPEKPPPPSPVGSLTPTEKYWAEYWASRPAQAGTVPMPSDVNKESLTVIKLTVADLIGLSERMYGVFGCKVKIVIAQL